MRALKIAVVVMGVLIVLGTIVLVVGIARRSATSVAAPFATPSTPVAGVLDEPAGTHIVRIEAVGGRLAIQLQGGGVDRVLLIDPVTGAVTGRISLAR